MLAAMLVAGVDGCRDGWIVALVEEGKALSLRTSVFAASFADLLSVTRDCAAVGVDIPIGLMTDGPRAPDIQARKRLRGPRASSVFPAPVRAVLGCTEYREACDASQAASGKRISKQLWLIVPKIREADASMTPALQQRVVEVHPEVSFWALNGGLTVPDSKHTPTDLEQRAALLASQYGTDLRSLSRPKQATEDDLLDAAAAAWTALRLAHGDAKRLPAAPALDARGLRMEIVY